MLKNRKIVESIISYLDFPEALILLGARQVGKTSIMKLLYNYLEKQNKKVFFYDLEQRAILEQFNRETKDIYQFILDEGIDTKQKNYIFIDEIQYMEDPSNFIKIIVDHHREIKIIASGSSTLKIKQKFKDALVGRKIEFLIQPLDFEEYLDFSGNESSLSLIQKKEISEFHHKTLIDLFYEYLTFGGYPRIAQINRKPEKEKLLNEIVQSYVYKDIAYLFAIEKIREFNLLVQLLANQSGQLVNLNQLQNALKLNRQTLERYLFILENTFIIKRIFPYFRNRTTEISKMQKVYFLDTGIRNLSLKNFERLNNRMDKGVTIENGIFTEILKNNLILDEVKYWRTKAGNEVDFIIEGKKIIAAEVKSTDSSVQNMPKGIKFFAQKYSPEKCLYVYAGKLNYRENFYQVPFYKFGQIISELENENN